MPGTSRSHGARAGRRGGANRHRPSRRRALGAVRVLAARLEAPYLRPRTGCPTLISNFICSCDTKRELGGGRDSPTDTMVPSGDRLSKSPPRPPGKLYPCQRTGTGSHRSSIPRAWSICRIPNVRPLATEGPWGFASRTRLPASESPPRGAIALGETIRLRAASHR